MLVFCELNYNENISFVMDFLKRKWILNYLIKCLDEFLQVCILFNYFFTDLRFSTHNLLFYF